MILYAALVLAALLHSQDRTQTTKGPGVACAESFAIELKQGESLTANAGAEDFIVYEFERPDGSTIIYAGNYPQPGGVVLETKLQWPAVIVVHGSQEIANRVVIGPKADVLCKRKAAR